MTKRNAPNASPLISGEGTVVWTREFDPSRVGVAPGMGVRFDKLGVESHAVLDKILAQKNKDVAEPKFDGPPSQATTRVTPPALAGSLVAAAKQAGAPSLFDRDHGSGHLWVSVGDALKLARSHPALRRLPRALPIRRRAVTNAGPGPRSGR